MGYAENDALESTMIVHPVYVYWCVSCGKEAPDDSRACLRCASRVRRHQRVIDVTDSPGELHTRPGAGKGLLRLRSLKAALADISAAEGVGGVALFFSEQGADPTV